MFDSGDDFNIFMKEKVCICSDPAWLQFMTSSTLNAFDQLPVSQEHFWAVQELMRFISVGCLDYIFFFKFKKKVWQASQSCSEWVFSTTCQFSACVKSKTPKQWSVITRCVAKMKSLLNLVPAVKMF